MSYRGKGQQRLEVVDTEDVIVHIFHPEKEFYDLEKMWSEEILKKKQ